MPHTTFVKVTRLRMTYTGEPYRLARERTRESSNSHPLVPDTTSVHQRMLETALLLAIRDAAPTISSRENSDHYRGHKVFRMVSPSPSSLTVGLFEDVAGRFFRSLLPPQSPCDCARGVPGLRVVLEKNRLRLHLLDQEDRLTDACVIIRGIGGQAWNSIWSVAKVADCDHTCVDPRLKESPRLSFGERHMLSWYWSHCGPIALGSAMLRRVGLLASAFSLDVWTGNGGSLLNIEIDDGPSVPIVLNALQHPRAGITGGQFVVDMSRGPTLEDTKYARIVDIDPTPDTFTGRSAGLVDAPALALRTLPRWTLARNTSQSMLTAARRVDA